MRPANSVNNAEKRNHPRRSFDKFTSDELYDLRQRFKLALKDCLFRRKKCSHSTCLMTKEVVKVYILLYIHQNETKLGGGKVQTRSFIEYFSLFIFTGLSNLGHLLCHLATPSMASYFVYGQLSSITALVVNHYLL